MTMNSNALRQESYQSQVFTTTKVATPKVNPFISVDLKELNRVTFQLLKREEYEKNRGVKVFFKKDGRLQSKSLYSFIQTGISGEIKGLNACLNIKDHVERIAAMQLLECVVECFSLKLVSGYEDITPEMIAHRRKLIEMFPETNTPTAEWIASYKAHVAAAYESKEIKKARVDAFLEAMANLNTIKGEGE